MGGFFGGGQNQNTRTDIHAAMGPWQQQFLDAATPTAIMEALLQGQLVSQGGQDLMSAVAGAGGPLTQALQAGPSETAYPGIATSVGGGLADIIAKSGTDLMSGDPSAVIRPLAQQFTRTVVPGITSAATAAGVPGGSAETNLLGDAIESFGTGAGTALAETATNRFSAGTRGLGLADALALQGPQAGNQLDAL